MKRENKDAVLASYQDCVRKYGQPRRLLADNAGVYHGNRFIQYICDLWISLWQYKDKKQPCRVQIPDCQATHELSYGTH